MEANTTQEFFKEILPKRFKPEKAKGVNVTVQVTIINGEQENWITSIKDQIMKVDEGIYPEPELTLKMSKKDFLDLVNGKISAEKAFFSGKINFKGNITLALKLREAGFL